MNQQGSVRKWDGRRGRGRDVMPKQRKKRLCDVRSSAKEQGRLLETEKGKETESPIKPPDGTQACQL